MANIIEIKNIKKSYNKFKLGPINLEIEAGTIVGLIGENGAGKTTLIKLLLNIINKDEGEIQIFGLENQANEKIIKEDIAVVLDNAFFPEIMLPSDIDKTMNSIYKNWDHELYQSYLEKFKIPNKPIKTMSKGMRKKLEIATALSHHPKLLILDEPTSGLDPVVRNECLEIFQEFMKDESHAILLSTHITSDLEHIADRIIFLDQGSIVLDQNINDLFDNYGILKCGIEEFSKIDYNDWISYKKNKYSYDCLVDNLEKMKKKYKDFVIDKITLEDLMLLVIKGEKQ